eukprot:m.105800 g.105800  ORF g.105800 m.105800 type:complete len:141 (-) comp27676_c0_seq4:574-996(-)
MRMHDDFLLTSHTKVDGFLLSYLGTALYNGSSIVPVCIAQGAGKRMIIFLWSCLEAFAAPPTRDPWSYKSLLDLDIAALDLDIAAFGCSISVRVSSVLRLGVSKLHLYYMRRRREILPSQQRVWFGSVCGYVWSEQQRYH